MTHYKKEKYRSKTNQAVGTYINRICSPYSLFWYSQLTSAEVIVNRSNIALHAPESASMSPVNFKKS